MSIPSESATIRTPGDAGPGPIPVAPRRRGVPRKIVIEPVLNGYRVRCGCQELVFEDRDTLLIQLGKYLSNPTEVERDYLANSIHRELHGAEIEREESGSVAPPPHTNLVGEQRATR